MSAVDSERAVSAICGLFTSGNTDAWRGTFQFEPKAPVMLACTSGAKDIDGASMMKGTKNLSEPHSSCAAALYHPANLSHAACGSPALFSSAPLL